MSDFISGAVMMACLVAGLFFLKFWKKSRDRLFLMFGIAFWILGLNRIAMLLTAQPNEQHLMVYVVRLIAFLLILLAIIDKNNRKSGP